MELLRCAFTLLLLTSSALLMISTATLWASSAALPAQWIHHLHLQQCALPCWNAIRPGETTLQIARQRVESSLIDTGEYHIANVFLADGQAIYILRAADESYRLSVSLFGRDNNSSVDVVFLQLDHPQGQMVALYPPSDELAVVERDYQRHIAEAVLYFRGRPHSAEGSQPCRALQPHQLLGSLLLSPDLQPQVAVDSVDSLRQRYGSC